MGNVKYIKNSRKIKKVTHLPGWMLKIKGNVDSKKGKGVCDEYITRLTKKLAALESDEVIAAENALHEVRKEAAVILTGFSEQKNALINIPKNTAGETPEVIRSNRRNNRLREEAISSLNSSIKILTTIHEQIINTNTVLDERLNKMRNNTAEKIHAYMVGIRCINLPDYKVALSETNDQAREIYLKKHEELDKRIHDVISNKMGADTEEVVA